MIRKILLLIFILSFIYLLGFWFSHTDRFVKRFDPEYFSRLYSNSQYVLGPKSVGGIGDDGLYAFAGYYYFFQKGDVSAVNFEHPPLGKYLIGLSVFLFDNELVINLIYFMALVYLTYRLSLTVLGKYYSLIPPAIIMVDPLFLDHTIRSQLDLPFTLFFTAGIYFFIKSRDKPVYLFYSQFFWGAAFSTRFFPLLLPLEIYMFILVFYLRKMHLKLYSASLLLPVLVYLLSHTTFFIYHPSVIEFLRHKKWMLEWFTGTPVKTGNILRNLYTGKLFDSTDNLVRNKEWSIFQPLIFSLSLIPVKVNVLTGFAFIYFLYAVFLTGGQAKFLMPVYPLLAVLAVRNLDSLYSIIRKWKQAK